MTPSPWISHVDTGFRQVGDAMNAAEYRDNCRPHEIYKADDWNFRQKNR